MNHPLIPCHFETQIIFFSKRTNILDYNNPLVFSINNPLWHLFDANFQVVLVVKNLAANAGDIRDIGLIPGSGRSPGGGGHGNILQYLCLENPTGRGAWWAIVHRFAQSRTRLK